MSLGDPALGLAILRGFSKDPREEGGAGLPGESKWDRTSWQRDQHGPGQGVEAGQGVVEATGAVIPVGVILRKMLGQEVGPGGPGKHGGGGWGQGCGDPAGGL